MFVPGGAFEPTSVPLALARGTGDAAALTFDDGPNPGDTDDLLDVLRSAGVQATFCVVGANVRQPGGRELLRRIVADGHVLGNHTVDHVDLAAWSRTRIEADLRENLQIIRDAVGNVPVPYFRAPFGSWGDSGEVAAALGMQPLGLGNVISDWDGNDLSCATLTRNLRGAITPGSVVLAHDGGGDRGNTVRAVRTVLSQRLAEGWTFTLPQGGVR